MSTPDLRVVWRADARSSACHRRIERGLKRFRPEVQNAVRALAARHPRLGELVLSFPALAVKLALAGAGRDAAAAMVIAGESLGDIAAAARLPLWTRSLPPEAFAGPVPRLPLSQDFFRRIAAHVPKTRQAADWLAAVAFAAVWGDEAFAVWLAREFVRAPKPKRGRRARFRTTLLTLWAWFSRRPGTRASELIDRAWNPAIGVRAALDAAAIWWAAVELFVELGDAPLPDVWMPAAEVDGYEFVPLSRAADVLEEARAMENCLRGFGADLADNYVRLWSVRQGSRRIATLRVDCDRRAPLPRLVELEAVRNQPPPPEVWLAAHRWLLMQDPAKPPPQPGPRTVPLDGATWRALWKPYWLTKRALPAWLPLAPKRDVLWSF